jgi:hypothetical protein
MTTCLATMLATRRETIEAITDPVWPVRVRLLVEATALPCTPREVLAAGSRLGFTGTLTRQILAAGELLGLLRFAGGLWLPTAGARAA